MNQADVWNYRYSGMHGAAHSDADVWVNAYADVLERVKHKPVIDLGCGAGRNACYLHDDGYTVIACDLSAVALELVKERRPDMTTCNFDMLDGLPFDDCSAGAVIASLSLHYFTLSDTERVLGDIYRVLVPDGYFLMRVNGMKEYELKDKDDTLHMIEPDYYMNKHGTPKRYFDAHSLARLLNRFTVLSVEERSGTYLGHAKYYVEALAQKRT